MTIDTKPLSERLRGLAREYRATMDKEVALSWGADAQRELFSIADALDAKDALLREAADALRGVIGGRLKPDFDRARTLLSKLTEATKP